jgi:hypothetical protein
VGHSRVGIRNISLYFLARDHLKLFLFAINQVHPCGLSITAPGRLSGYTLAERVGVARVHHGLSPGETLEELCQENSHSIENLSWAGDKTQSRALHPFFNEQVVCIGAQSPALDAWLRDRRSQQHYITGRRAGEEKSVVEASGEILTSVHKSPIEAAIESYLYGKGSWLRGKEDRE